MDPLERLVDTLRPARLFVLAGAGCSTASGIPDYRGPGTLARARKPVSFRSFVDDDAAYRRYWARSYVGWPRLASARPNAAHHALATLERSGRLIGLVTQNVDSLHQAAGSRALVELHGALRDVVCLGCGRRVHRDELQAEMAETHPGGAAATAPDGDADLDELGDFVAPTCACGGRWKPDVVFFGENVPRDRVDRAFEWLDAATDVLVVGSSLTVFSGWRFVKRAHERGLRVHIVNRGPTRADAVATTVVDADLTQALPRLC